MEWFSNLKIRTKLMVSYLVLCVLVLCVGGMGINGLNMMMTNVNAIYYDAYVGTTNIKDLQAYLETVRYLMLQIIFPDKRNEISSLESEIQNVVGNTGKSIKVYEDAISNPEDTANIQELKKLLATYRDKRQLVIDAAKSGDYVAASDLYKNQFIPSHAALGNQINKMTTWNDNNGLNYIKDAEGSFSSAMKQMMTTIFLVLILAIVSGLFISRSIVNPLNSLVSISNQVAAGNLSHNINSMRKDEIGQLENSTKSMVNNLRDVIKNVQSSADNVAASSEQLTASADQSSQAANSVAVSIMEVAQGAEKQLIIVGETVNTAEKMSAEAEQIASNANIVASTSGKTAQSADQGRKAVETAINQMAFIQKTVEDLAQEITGLGVRSKEIGQIVETISGIAAQTNLLALNAAIEAARAGEQGRGFAVVAEEVRKLAEQSQEAAKQISSLIGAIQVDTDKAVQAMEAGTREVKTGAELVDNAGVAFKEIAALVNQTTSQVREISESIHHMANDSQTIVTGAQEINIVTRNTSGQTQSVSSATEEQLASMQEIASASQALAKRAEELQAITRKFVL